MCKILQFIEKKIQIQHAVRSRFAYLTLEPLLLEKTMPKVFWVKYFGVKQYPYLLQIVSTKFESTL
ncbi:hypothetical protein CJD36_022555 [Flavipsychrobacter stenotrophus]|uniref:Uncharacterized protein n=1 Tax=Flavipsychrobacter stenotrophus TaxID=2077091 RepID=A0A2S7SPG4_9BACT|nr:hypothetical protein CJD36_022555 [Flavipsychrobacter stenotrophus]